MSLSLQKVSEEDPTFQTDTNEETGQTIISGMGELHLEIIIDRLLREFKVKANVGRPQVAYKETILDTARSEGRFVRQTGGRGQYGHVLIEVEPLERGSGFVFENKSLGNIPRSLFRLWKAVSGSPCQRRPGWLCSCRYKSFFIRRFFSPGRFFRTCLRLPVPGF